MGKDKFLNDWHGVGERPILCIVGDCQNEVEGDTWYCEKHNAELDTLPELNENWSEKNYYAWLWGLL
jgi:hypothetical protein